MKDIRISSLELKRKNNCSFPKRASDFSNNPFWHYTRLKTASEILDGSCFHVRNMSSMNDIDEKNMHCSNSEFTHCLCFCNSKTEKIPMWYLYSGISGKGAAIGLTPSNLIYLLKSIDEVTTVDKKTVLKKDKDFDIEYGWTFYRKKDSPSQVMYKGNWYSLTDPEAFENNNYFIKAYQWEYEKEFRIVIHNNTKISYDKLVIDISSVYKKLKLKLAPEISKQEFASLIPSHKGFMRYLSEMPSYSDLGINMNLFERNFEGFLDYIEREINEARYENAQKICETLRNGGFNCKLQGEELTYGNI